MRNKKIKRVLFAFLFVGGVSLTGCTPDDEIIEYDPYYFKNSFEISNPSSNYNVNDTVWVFSEIQGSLVDTNTNKKVYFRDAYMLINMIIRDWNSADESSQNDHYSLVLKTPSKYVSYTKNAALLGLEFLKDENNYRFNVGIIFNSPGIYSIDFDYLEVLNPDNNQPEYYGGGIIQFKDVEDQYQEGYLIGRIDVEERNSILYNSLTETEKAEFQSVDSENLEKYYFVNVEELENE